MVPDVIPGESEYSPETAENKIYRFDQCKQQYQSYCVSTFEFYIVQIEYQYAKEYNKNIFNNNFTISHNRQRLIPGKK